MRRIESLAALLTLLLAGCAGPAALFGAKEKPPPVFRDPALTVGEASRMLALEPAGKREVQERLGPAERLAFDSGYEVWVYRAREPARGTDSAELVILFDPRGTLSKVRMRPATPGQ